MLWNPFLPNKVNFFVQEIWWGKIITSAQFQKRGYPFASMCPLCGTVEEILERLCIHSPNILRLQISLFSSLVGSWTCPFFIPLRFTYLLEKKDAKLWPAAPFCLLSEIWKERNKVVFEDETLYFEKLKSSFLRSFSLWASVSHVSGDSFVRIFLYDLSYVQG